MSYPTSFIVFEGMDNCGKSTLLQNALAQYPLTKELKFPKTLPSGALLRFGGEKDFETMFALFEHLDKRYTYLMDRFIPSNMVYDKVLRGEDVTQSLYYWKEFNRRFNVTTIILTRPHIAEDFEDDRIKLTRQQFNDALDEYKKYGPNFQLLNRDEKGQPSSCRPGEMIFVQEVLRSALNPL